MSASERSAPRMSDFARSRRRTLTYWWGGLTSGCFECAGEIEAAEAGCRRHPLYSEVALEVGFDEIQHSAQALTVQSFRDAERGRAIA